MLKLKVKLESVENYSIKYPCLVASKECPLKESDWCHQVLRVKNDPDFERISQKVKIDRRTLPYIFHLYKRNNLEEVSLENNFSEDQREGVLLQFIGKNKAFYRWRICFYCPENAVLKDVNAELPLRGLSKKEIKSAEKLQAGDIVEFKIKKFLDDGTIRIVIPFISIQN